MVQSRWFMLVLLVTVASTGDAQLAPVGPAFQVTTNTAGLRLPRVALDAAGRSVVVWYADDGDLAGVFARRYDANDVPLGGEFQVNTYTTGNQTPASVAADASGSFVIVWGSNGQDGSGYGVFGRRFDGSGTPLGPEFVVNAFTTNSQWVPSVAVGADGAFIVAWESGHPFSHDIVARRFDATGSAQGADFLVNTYTTGFQRFPSAAGDGEGNFVVVWGSDGQDGDSYGVFGRRFNAAGAPQGGEFQVNTYTTGAQSGNAFIGVTMSGSGSSVVVWTSQIGQDGDLAGVFGRRYDSLGVPQGADFQVNGYTTGNQFNPSVAADTAGNFLVAWENLPTNEIRARYFDSAGTPSGDEFAVSTSSGSNPRFPWIASDSAGQFVVTWMTYNDGVFARRFSSGRFLRGRTFAVSDPTGVESQRSVLGIGSEAMTDIGPEILGNPAADGALLRVVATGTTASDDTYVLDAAGWTPIHGGYRYRGPTGPDGDPVKMVVIRRTTGGRALLRVLLRGSVGTQPLDVVPPNPGIGGGIVLTINGGASYCVGFGGPSGGSVGANTARLWRIRNATGQTCPTP